MSVDINIYVSNIIKFFKNNPKDLISLIPKEKEELFYEKIKETATKNFKKGEEIALTKKQMIEICVELNGAKILETKTNMEIFQETPIGVFCLN